MRQHSNHARRIAFVLFVLTLGLGTAASGFGEEVMQS